MFINTPSKKETITFFPSKNQLTAMLPRRLSKYFSHCCELGSSFPVTHLGSTLTGCNEISYTKLVGFLLSTKLASPHNCTN